MGKIKILLSLTDFADGSDETNGSHYLRLQVIDNGIGISAKDQTKLFQPFSKLEHSAKLNPNGTGLGLSNCKRVLESMGSNIWLAESTERTGFYDSKCGTVIAFTIKLFPRQRKQVSSKCLQEITSHFTNLEEE